MASERERPTPQFLELLRSVCQDEIVAAKLVRAATLTNKAGEDYLGEREPAKSWIKAHGQRMRLTNPANILRVLDHLDRVTEAGEGLWAFMASDWTGLDPGYINGLDGPKQEAIDAWNKATDS